MTRYRIGDGTIVDTENASHHWHEKQDWDGRNYISRATGTQWDHQRLYRSRRGRYYVENTSQWQGTHATVEWISEQEACRWLLLMNHNLPAELESYVEQVSE